MRTAWLCLALPALASFAHGRAEGPRVTHVGTVAPDILGVTVQAQRTEHAKQEPYLARPGDTVNDSWVFRGGKRIGRLAGKNADLLMPIGKLIGDPLDTRWADSTASYSILSRDDADYARPVRPTAVHRKSKPTDLINLDAWDLRMPARHVLYLRLPSPLKPGKRYVLSFSGGRLPEHEFTHRPDRTRSEAVHVSHIGFHTDDPVKIAFLSCWMGSGGGLPYKVGTPFHVIDDATGRSRFDSRVRLSKAADDRTEDAYKRNYNETDVYEMEFSELRMPGTYRVSVDGVGCSHPFEIGPDVWHKAFLVSAKGFYYQRSGIPIGPPYSSGFARPRPFHPADGVKVYQSTCPLMDSGNGLNARGTDKDNFGNLVAGKTDEVLGDYAWGGYFDAGDWDRRIQHLHVTRLLLELAELFPDYAETVALNIPESRNGLPDLIDEALFNLDFYRRMQMPDGGVRGGIESAEHPKAGEASWQESLDVMAYAPGPWSSHYYAGVAARAAFVLQRLYPRLARRYRRSAIAAMEWAEKDMARRADEKLPHQVNDDRNLAAAELFRLTGEAKWHDLFMATTAFKDPRNDLAVWKKHSQREAPFVYVRTDRPGRDEEVARNCRQAILREADQSVALGRGTAFHWTKRNSWEPVIWTKLSTPQVTTILRAHALTGDEKYLRAAILGCQSGLGANPANLCYTTGLGHDFPRHPLIVDADVTAQPPPPGITVAGPIDTKKNKDHWAFNYMKPVLHPAIEKWPTTEAYFDVYLFPVMSEFTVDQTMGPNAYAWGYLAGRTWR